MYFFKHDLVSRQVNWLDSRGYSNDNINWYPSVSTILGILDKGVNFREWLINNGRNADYITTKAMEEGSQVHGLIERFCTNPDSPVLCTTYDAMGNEAFTHNKDVWTMFSRFIEFHNKVRPELLAVEQSICSEELGFGGTIDIVCRFGGQTWLIDNKTGSYLYDDYDIQLAAYLVLWNKMHPEYQIDQVGILHLDAQTRTEGKGGAIQGKGWKLQIIGDVEKCMENYKIFESLFNVWKWRNPNWRPLFVELPDHFTRKEIEESWKTE